MLVDLFQSRGRAVAHALHSVLVGDVQRQHDRGVVMSQVMKAEVQTKLLTNLNELLRDGIGYMLNDEVALPWDRKKRIDDERRDLNFSFALGGFGAFADDPFTGVVLQHGAANIDCVFLAIDILHLEATDLRATQAAAGAKQDGATKPSAFYLVQQALDIIILRHRDIRLNLLRKLSLQFEFGKINIKCCRKQAMSAADGLGCILLGIQ